MKKRQLERRKKMMADVLAHPSYRPMRLRELAALLDIPRPKRRELYRVMDELVKGKKLHVAEQFTTVHNYIDTEAMILRKGAVSAKHGEKLLIPVNMRDGSLLCVGKGNDDWNQSAPHGAGRLMSRSAAKQSFTVSEFKKQMKGIYSTSIGAGTLDECPMAYKDMDSIVENVGETVEILDTVRPLYNFKSSAE